MNLFNLFSRRKKLSLKSIFEPVLDRMWVCTVNFTPWDPDRHGVKFMEVPILDAHATPDGIYVKTSRRDPFSGDEMDGYIDKIEMRYRCRGFFETEEAAKKAYNDLMNKWIDVIKSKMEPYEHN